jgi:hypothetical protein
MILRPLESQVKMAKHRDYAQNVLNERCGLP